jgi:hypothetical protein
MATKAKPNTTMWGRSHAENRELKVGFNGGCKDTLMLYVFKPRLKSWASNVCRDSSGWICGGRNSNPTSRRAQASRFLYTTLIICDFSFMLLRSRNTNLIGFTQPLRRFMHMNILNTNSGLHKLVRLLGPENRIVYVSTFCGSIFRAKG